MRQPRHKRSIARPPDPHGVAFAAASGQLMPNLANRTARVTSARDPAAVGAEGDLVDVGAVVDRAQRCTVGSTPVADRRIIAPGDEQPAVGTEIEPDDRLAMSGQRFQRPAGDVPQPHGVVESAAGEALAVRTEPDFPDVAGMAAKLCRPAASLDLPDANDGVFAGSGEQLAVG